MPHRIHGLLCECQMCAADPSVHELADRFGWSSKDVLAAMAGAARIIRGSPRQEPRLPS